MELTPPLTRSPASPPHTYCASETSSPDYPSPELVGQHYKISSIHGLEPHCSMAPTLDSEGTLPPLDSMATVDWTSTAPAMPSVLSTEYDPFGSYDSSIPGAYAHDAYAHHGPSFSHASPPPPPPLPHSRSPVPSGSRVAGSFGSGQTASSTLTPRMKMETTPDYGRGVELSQYPSPRSVHVPYPGDMSNYPAPTSGYLSDSQSTTWSKGEYAPVDADQFYAGAGDPASAFVQSGQRSIRMPRPRRTQRRLTTKEEANFQCEVKGCGKLFSRSYNFKAHMETHDEKREYPFPCTVADCSKKFVRKTDLQRHHQSVHMKERNHKCDFCGRLFARKDTLRRHMEDGCSKRFDIGTLDLRADSYDSISSSARQLNGVDQASGSLPPLAMPAIGSNGLLAPGQISRHGSSISGPDQNHRHSWGQ